MNSWRGQLWTRRNALALAWGGALSSLAPRRASAFGEEGAFHARLLATNEEDRAEDLSSSRRWAWEVMRRTSAPGRLSTRIVRPDSAELLQEPFLVWAGRGDPGALDLRAIRGLRKYLRMGGVLIVDDRAPEEGGGQFGQRIRRELPRILPQSALVRLTPKHVLFKTFYILDEPVGRVRGPSYVEAVVRGGAAQVLFLNHDLMGALSRKGDTWALPMEVGGSDSREKAVRFAVNIAMYVLCSNYKDDQVHAPFLMRRRHKRR